MNLTVILNGESLPFKLNTRVWMQWEQQTELRRSMFNDNTKIEHKVKLYQLALNAGAGADNYTFDQVVDMMDDNLGNAIDEAYQLYEIKTGLDREGIEYNSTDDLAMLQLAYVKHEANKLGVEVTQDDTLETLSIKMGSMATDATKKK